MKWKKRTRRIDEELVEANSGKPRPPPTPGAGRIRKRPPRKVVLPIDNPAQATPSNQPTGVQVSGQHGAVMPNTSLVPASLAPTGDNTRDDDKPIPVSIREGK